MTAMCTVSVIMDYGRQMWPNPIVQQPVVVERTPTPREWAEFLELVEKARKFDELAGQADCEDPAKAEWMQQVEERLKALEQTS